jgi:mono/diheme cytochrome c family protein
MKIIKISLILCSFALLAVACGETPKSNNTKADTNTPTSASKVNDASTPATDEVASGKKIYTEKCSQCHKENGTGGKVTIEGKTINAYDFTSAKMKEMPDEKYIKYIKEGVPDEGMPAFKDQLNDEQIKSVIKYIRQEFQKQ